MGYMFTQGNTATSVLDEAIDANALFTPKVAPILLPNGTETDQFTVYREDGENQYPLNVGVTDRYYAGDYTSIVNTAEQLFPETCNTFKMFGNGGRIMFTQDLGQEHSFGDGDSLSLNLLTVASLDGTWKTAMYGFSFRPFCTNQIPVGQVHMAAKRTTNHERTLVSRAAVLANSIGKFGDFVKQAEHLKLIKLNASGFRTLLAGIVPTLPEDAATKAVNFADKREAAIRYFYDEEVATFGENAWSFYNAVQSYELNRANEKGAEKATDFIRTGAQPLANAAATRALALA